MDKQATIGTSLTRECFLLQSSQPICSQLRCDWLQPP